MTIRPYRASDATALQFMANQTGFPYPDLDSPMIEACLVVEDEQGDVIGAVAAERICQLYLWKNQDLRPAMGMSVLRHLHEQMATELRKRGYDEANCALPEKVAKSFGRRLCRFGWTRQWPVWAIKF